MTKAEQTSTGDALPVKWVAPTSAPEFPMSGTEDPMSFAYRYKNATWVVTHRMVTHRMVTHRVVNRQTRHEVKPVEAEKDSASGEATDSAT